MAGDDPPIINRVVFILFSLADLITHKSFTLTRLRGEEGQGQGI